ncbi:MAG: hypothetical protein P0Y55_01570 [Candidatus Cohnella colombiensis]|uniref:DUF3159 domain-containing protein n=1 Tax=Candidatus Cohnella colombiensis TaxID=3121368 RepID=A0AA95EXA6_9BACL|nr:MAG: hypothetical protein P0Y55_01570 [Cohnella sp.]
MMTKLTKIPLSVVVTILLNGVVPYFIYIFLKDRTSGLTALLIATCIPLFEQLIYFVKKRVLDHFGLLMIGTFVLSVGLVLLGGSEELVLLRESFVTAAVGAVFLISLLLSKPLIYHLAIRFVPSANVQALEQKWRHPQFRQGCRLITAIWAVLLIGEAIIRIWLIYTLSIANFLIVSHFLFYSIIGIAIICSVLMRRRMSVV